MTFNHSAPNTNTKPAEPKFQPLTCRVNVIHPLMQYWPAVSLILAFSLGCLSYLLFSLGGIETTTISMVTTLAAGIIGLVMPPVILFKRFPTRDQVTLNEDNLYFEKRGIILFKELDSFSTDYMMKIHKKGARFSMLIGGTISHPSDETEINFKEWLTAFDHQIHAWMLNKAIEKPYTELENAKENLKNLVDSQEPITDALAAVKAKENAVFDAIDKHETTPDLPKRKYFFGSLQARLMGLGMIFSSAGILYVCWKTGNLNYLAFGVIGCIAGLRLMSKL